METKRDLIQELREIVEQLPSGSKIITDEGIKIERNLDGADIYSRMFTDDSLNIGLYNGHYTVQTARLGSDYELTLELLPLVKESVEDYLEQSRVNDREKLEQLLKQREELDKEIEKLKEVKP